MGVSVIRIQRDGLLVQLAGLLDGRGAAGFVLQRARLQHQVVRLRVDRGRGAQARELHLERARDRRGNLVLHLKHVGQRIVVVVRPDLCTGAGVHQFHHHPHLIGFALDAAVQEVGDVQRLADGFRDFVAVAIVRRRVPGNHRERGILAERVGEFLGDAVAEVALLGIATEVGEGQHHQGVFRGIENRRGGFGQGGLCCRLFSHEARFMTFGKAEGENTGYHYRGDDHGCHDRSELPVPPLPLGLCGRIRGLDQEPGQHDGHRETGNQDNDDRRHRQRPAEIREGTRHYLNQHRNGRAVPRRHAIDVMLFQTGEKAELRIVGIRHGSIPCPEGHSLA